MWSEFLVAEAPYAPYPGRPFDEDLIIAHVPFLAEFDGEPVGTAYLSLRNPDTAFVAGVYVKPLFRRQGVATELMRAAALEARDRGREHIGLIVELANQSAVKFYEEIGYSMTGAMMTSRTSNDSRRG
jgi:ribosomal protein S18 acetylase RimI-like enzyme